MLWKIKKRSLDCGKTLLMGVLNLTEDSFSDGGKFLQPANALDRALEMQEQGADILDIGAESTRPGAGDVPARDEWERILPVLQLIRKKTAIPVSIDTTKPEVAKICLAEGADIINDVSGLKDSGSAMAGLVRETGAGLVLMHRRGNPRTMQSLASYKNVVSEVLAELQQSVDLALGAGIESKQIVLDPGLGFAKTPEQSLEILRALERFHELSYPVLLGPSRKSFVGLVTGRPVSERIFGTAAVVALAVAKKIQIIRVHDVQPMRDVIRMTESISGDEYVRSFKMGKY